VFFQENSLPERSLQNLSMNSGQMNTPSMPAARPSDKEGTHAHRERPETPFQRLFGLDAADMQQPGSTNQCTSSIGDEEAPLRPQSGRLPGSDTATLRSIGSRIGSGEHVPTDTTPYRQSSAEQQQRSGSAHWQLHEDAAVQPASMKSVTLVTTTQNTSPTELSRPKVLSAVACAEPTACDNIGKRADARPNNQQDATGLAACGVAAQWNSSRMMQDSALQNGSVRTTRRSVEGGMAWPGAGEEGGKELDSFDCVSEDATLVGVVASRSVQHTGEDLQLDASSFVQGTCSWMCPVRSAHVHAPLQTSRAFIEHVDLLEPPLDRPATSCSTRSMVPPRAYGVESVQFSRHSQQDNPGAGTEVWEEQDGRNGVRRRLSFGRDRMLRGSGHSSSSGLPLPGQTHASGVTV
jgi:hypothetical protein